MYIRHTDITRRGNQSFWRSGAAAWRTDRKSWRIGIDAGVVKNCGVPKRKVLMYQWRILFRRKMYARLVPK